MNSQKKSLYTILGVNSTADKKAIKSAYRKSAKKNHPDVGGNPEKFALVKKAHDILMDDERRTKYDSTGDESEKSPDNTLGNIINCISFHFNAVLQECSQSGTSPLVVDMVQRIKSKMNSSISENEKNLRITKGILEFDKKMVGRFKKKSKEGDNVFENIISSRISALNISISNIDNTIKTHKLALEMIREFTYKSDEEPYESPGDRMMNLMGASNYWSYP
jgi:DnaJ-class molecular chaperone